MFQSSVALYIADFSGCISRLVERSSSEAMATLFLRLAILGVVGRGVARRMQRPILSSEDLGIYDDSEPTRNSVFEKTPTTLGAALNDVVQRIQNFVRTFQAHTAPLDGLLEGRALADETLRQRGTFPSPLASVLERAKLERTKVVSGNSLDDSSIPLIFWQRLAIVATLCCVIVSALTAFCCCTRSKSRKRKQFVHNGKVIYEWEQFEKTMMMYVAIPEGIGRDDLDIGIEPRQITIGRKGMPAFIRERLYLLVDEGKSSWKVDKHELEICFVKLEPTDWPGLLLPHVRLPENRR